MDVSLVRRVEIDDSALISSSVPETDASVWVSGATYALGAEVIRLQTHRVYVCLAAGVSSVAPEDDASRWSDDRPVNRWAMFDLQVSTKTVFSDDIEVVIEPGRVDTIGVVGAIGVGVEVTSRYAGDVVYQEWLPLDMTERRTWYQYFCGGFNTVPMVTFFGLPPVSGQITVKIIGDEQVSCGALIAGNSFAIGGLRREPKIPWVDYSKTITDDFGATTFVPRASAHRFIGDLNVPKRRISQVYRQIELAAGTPSLWVVSDDPQYAFMNTFGWCTKFEPSAPYEQWFICDLQLQSVI